MDTQFILNEGNTAWLMLSAMAVLLMTVPALAFFYGGMVRRKTVLNMMMMSYGATGVVGVIWVLFGYSMSFGSDIAGLFGNPFQLLGLEGLQDMDPSNALSGSGVPSLVWVTFQATFAIITVALISGAIADRTKFSGWILFVVIWIIIVYFPLCHMVWGGGLLSGDGPIASLLSTPLDFAGGTVVHINAGIAGLVLAIIIGKRKGWDWVTFKPHNLPYVMLGAALLWFGWFGFNAGSAGAANEQAGLALINTFVATAAAILGWLIVEKIKDGHATSLGAASGMVAGLVAITPGAGFVSPLGAIAIGVITGSICALAVGIKYKLKFDDSLDVVGVHLVGGIMGTVLIGFFATADDLWDGSKAGIFYGGNGVQLLTQITVALIALVFSGVLTFIIGTIINKTIGLRISNEDEVQGVDLTTHGELAYDESN